MSKLLNKISWMRGHPTLYIQELICKSRIGWNTALLGWTCVGYSFRHRLSRSHLHSFILEYRILYFISLGMGAKKPGQRTKAETKLRLTNPLQGDPSAWVLYYVAINLGGSPGLWAATAASYCQAGQGNSPNWFRQNIGLKLMGHPVLFNESLVPSIYMSNASLHIDKNTNTVQPACKDNSLCTKPWTV